MKSFNVRVDDEDAKFFRELMDKFNFVRYEEVEGFEEVRVYPAADFEIRSQKENRFRATQEGVEKLPQYSKENKGSVDHRDAMEDIRSVISKIDRLRDHSK